MKSFIKSTGMFVLIVILLQSAIAASQSVEQTKFHDIGELILSAYSEERYHDVKQLCFEYLYLAQIFRDDWNYGNAIEAANRYLGLLALQSGDFDSAIAYLILSSKTPGSPQLESFGPNVSLAKALLEKQYTEPVLKYLDEIKRFWELEDGRIEEWKDQIQRGQIPDFGPNLRYVR